MGGGEVGFNLLLDNVIYVGFRLGFFWGFAARGFTRAFFFLGGRVGGGSIVGVGGGVREVIGKIFLAGVGGFLSETAFGQDPNLNFRVSHLLTTLHTGRLRIPDTLPNPTEFILQQRRLALNKLPLNIMVILLLQHLIHRLLPIKDHKREPATLHTLMMKHNISLDHDPKLFKVIFQALRLQT